MTRRGLLWALAAACGGAIALAELGPRGAGRAAPAQDAGTARVRRRGYLVAGVPRGAPPFGAPDRRGGWQGLDVALARAVASEVLRSPERVHLLPLASGERVAAIRGGAADLVAAAFAAPAGTAPRLPSGVQAAGPYFTDGFALLVRRGGAPRSLSQLDGTLVGVLPGSPAGAAVRAAAGPHGHPVLAEEDSAGVAARDLAAGRLRAVAGGEAACRALVAYDPELQLQPLPELGKEAYWALLPGGAQELAAAVRRAIAALPRGPSLAAALRAWAGAPGQPPLPQPRTLLTPNSGRA